LLMRLDNSSWFLTAFPREATSWRWAQGCLTARRNRPSRAYRSRSMTREPALVRRSLLGTFPRPRPKRAGRPSLVCRLQLPSRRRALICGRREQLLPVRRQIQAHPPRQLRGGFRPGPYLAATACGASAESPMATAHGTRFCTGRTESRSGIRTLFIPDRSLLFRNTA